MLIVEKVRFYDRNTFCNFIIIILLLFSKWEDKSKGTLLGNDIHHNTCTKIEDMKKILIHVKKHNYDLQKERNKSTSKEACIFIFTTHCNKFP